MTRKKITHYFNYHYRNYIKVRQILYLIGYMCDIYLITLLFMLLNAILVIDIYNYVNNHAWIRRMCEVSRASFAARVWTVLQWICVCKLITREKGVGWGWEGGCCSEYVGALVVWPTNQLTHNQLSLANSSADPRKIMRVSIYIYLLFSFLYALRPRSISDRSLSIAYT